MYFRNVVRQILKLPNGKRVSRVAGREEAGVANIKTQQSWKCPGNFSFCCPIEHFNIQSLGICPFQSFMQFGNVSCGRQNDEKFIQVTAFYRNLDIDIAHRSYSGHRWTRRVHSSLLLFKFPYFTKCPSQPLFKQELCFEAICMQGFVNISCLYSVPHTHTHSQVAVNSEKDKPCGQLYQEAAERGTKEAYLKWRDERKNEGK